MSTALFALMVTSFIGLLGALATQEMRGALLVSAVLIMLAMVGYLNQQGRLYSAVSLFIIGYMVGAIIGLLLSNATGGITSTYTWIDLTIIPIFAGLALPFWAPLLFGVLDIIIISVYSVNFHEHTNAYFTSNDDQFIFFVISSFFILSISALTAIYAHSVEKAVIEADRAVELEQAKDELEQAHAELAEAYSRLEDLAARDPVTGLLNQRALRQQLPIEADRATQSRQPLGVIFADLDHFKHVNDTWGHHAGDIVLAHLAACLRANVRVADIVARYGGEEFIIVMPGQGTTDTALMAERLRMIVADSPIILPDGQRISITLSLGVAILPDDGRTVEAILVAADAAMYRAKHSGRNCVCMAARTLQTDAT